MLTNLFDDVWFLHFDNEGGDGGDGGGDGGDGGAGGGAGGAGDTKTKTFTQADVDKIVTTRTEKARKAQRETLEKFEQLQADFRGTEEQRAELEEQVTTLRKSVLTAEEIRKREEKKAKDAYETALTNKTKEAQTWESRYRDVKIKTDVTKAGVEHGILPQAIDMVIASLRPSIKMTESKDDAGNFIDFTTLVDFNDVGSDGKAIVSQLAIGDTIKRMKELPDQYGHLFAAPNGGGIGGSNGRPAPSGKVGFRPGMSQADYMKLRKENPSAIYGDD